MNSYLPYLIELLIIHVVVASGVFQLVRRRNGPIAGLAAGILILILGSGYQNLFWAFQDGIRRLGRRRRVGHRTVPAGPGRGRRSRGSILLVIGLACSSIGMVFLVAAAVELVVRGGRRWLAVVPPAAVYIAWYLLVGPARLVATPEPVHARSRQGRRLLPEFRDQHCRRGRDRDHPLTGGLIAATALVAAAWITWRRRDAQTHAWRGVSRDSPSSTARSAWRADRSARISPTAAATCTSPRC